MNLNETYEELRSLLCNQDRVLKELVWTIARNQKLDKPRNVLLIGELGSGKTTIVKNVAKKMNVPLASVSGFCGNNGINASKLINGFTNLLVQNEKREVKGIVLLEDMKNCFIYGGFNDLKDLIVSGVFKCDNYFLDISNVMFIGEIDIDGYEDCFKKENAYFADNLDDMFLTFDYEGDEVKQFILDLTDFGEDVADNLVAYCEKYRRLLRSEFLSVEAKKAFSKKIYMDALDKNNIKRVLTSPISDLHSYCDDLDDDYLNSDEFINAVIYHIQESLVGFHDLDDAVSEVSSSDFKRKKKVYKNNSLMRL